MAVCPGERGWRLGQGGALEGEKSLDSVGGARRVWEQTGCGVRAQETL